MKKIIILIPIYNDWESMNKLLTQISDQIRSLKGYQIKIIIINDGSSIPRPKIIIPKNIDSLKIINMATNKGHTSCIAYGIHNVVQNEKFDNLILMDGDGEDRPEEILSLINKNLELKKNSIVAKRVKRSESFIFKILYELHKLITLIFTGNMINFGNFTMLTKEDLFLISNKKELWNSYSGTFKKYIKDYQEINSVRGTRYFGPSKMSIFKLIIHSFSIIATFKYDVYLRSAIMIILLTYLNSFLNYFSMLLQILIVVFNLVIFLISLKIYKNNLIDNHQNLKNEEYIKH